MRYSPRVIGLVLLPLLCAACGPQASYPKSSQPESGGERVASAQLPGEPAQSGMPATPTKAEAPATLAEVFQAIDLRKLPKLDGAQVQIEKATQIQYSAPGRLADAGEFYRKKLTELGWIEDKTPIPGLDAKESVYAGFDKAGFRVYVSANKTYQKEGSVDVYLHNIGNVDPRQFARQADAKPTFFRRDYVSYATAAQAEAAIEFSRKDLTERGWKGFRVALAKFHVKDGRFLLGFANNGMSLCVTVKGEKDNPTVVEYRAE